VDIDILRTRALAIVRCRGRLVLSDGAALLRDTVRQALSAGLDVVLDFPHVTQIDAHGAGVLAELFRLARDRGRSLALSRIDERVHRVLRVTGLDAVIPGVTDRGLPAAVAGSCAAVPLTAAPERTEAGLLSFTVTALGESPLPSGACGART
jgi:anti-sigma B factor antagonist